MFFDKKDHLMKEKKDETEVEIGCVFVNASGTAEEKRQAFLKMIKDASRLKTHVKLEWEEGTRAVFQQGINGGQILASLADSVRTLKLHLSLSNTATRAPLIVAALQSLPQHISELDLSGNYFMRKNFTEEPDIQSANYDAELQRWQASQTRFSTRSAQILGSLLEALEPHQDHLTSVNLAGNNFIMDYNFRTTLAQYPQLAPKLNFENVRVEEQATAEMTSNASTSASAEEDRRNNDEGTSLFY